MTLATGEDVTVAIRWADPWGASANNYDLVLSKGKTVVGSSRDVQAGTGDPFEIIEYTAATAGRYEIAIRRVSGAPTPRMQLLVGSSEDVKLTYQVAAGTLSYPRRQHEPRMLAVGAVNVDHPTEIEPYSSRGHAGRPGQAGSRGGRLCTHRDRRPVLRHERVRAVRDRCRGPGPPGSARPDPG